MTPQEQLSGKIPLLLAGYVAGLAIMFAGVLVFESRWVVGAALALLAAVSAFGYHWFRCPVCGTSVLQYSMRELRGWWHGPRSCPFCEVDLAQIENETEPAATASQSV